MQQLKFIQHKKTHFFNSCCVNFVFFFSFSNSPLCCVVGQKKYIPVNNYCDVCVCVLFAVICNIQTYIYRYIHVYIYISSQWLLWLCVIKNLKKKNYRIFFFYLSMLDKSQHHKHHHKMDTPGMASNSKIYHNIHRHCTPRVMYIYHLYFECYKKKNTNQKPAASNSKKKKCKKKKNITKKKTQKRKKMWAIKCDTSQQYSFNRCWHIYFVPLALNHFFYLDIFHDFYQIYNTPFLMPRKCWLKLLYYFRNEQTFFFLQLESFVFFSHKKQKLDIIIIFKKKCSSAPELFPLEFFFCSIFFCLG